MRNQSQWELKGRDPYRLVSFLLKRSMCTLLQSVAYCISFLASFPLGFPSFFVFNKRNNAENGSLHRAFEFFGFFFLCLSAHLTQTRGLETHVCAPLRFKGFPGVPKCQPNYRPIPPEIRYCRVRRLACSLCF